MTSIWEATCECGKEARVELHRESGVTFLKIGCDDHWVDLPTEGLKTALAGVEPDRKDKS